VSFAEARRNGYFARQEDFVALDRAAAIPGGRLVVTGQSGIGKSGLLCNWYLSRCDSTEFSVIAHFIGAGADTSSATSIALHLMTELTQRFAIDFEIPATADEILGTLGLVLHACPPTSNIVILLDALDRLDPSYGGPELTWLPTQLPENVRIIAGTLDGTTLSAITRNGWPLHQVEPLDVAARRAIATEYLARYRKSLASPLLDRLCEADACAVPLYLRSLLEEMRLHRAHETIGATLDHYLQSTDPLSLFDSILERYEADFENERLGLVADAFGALLISRHGFSEGELLRFLGNAEALGLVAVGARHRECARPPIRPFVARSRDPAHRGGAPLSGNIRKDFGDARATRRLLSPRVADASECERGRVASDEGRIMAGARRSHRRFDRS
jgi:hypothetical protein